MSAASTGLSVEAAHHYARVYGAARAGCLGELCRAGCSEEEAEDIFAATLERIMGKRDPPGEGYGQAQTVALLKKACRQRLIDERRRHDVLRIVPLSEALARCDPTSQSTEESAEAREAVAIGSEAISSLPERDRRIFLQRHRLGLSPEEILRRNPGLSRRTYRKVMQRANARALAAFEEIRSGARCAEMRSAQLRRYVAEETSETERRTIRAHLGHCRSCGIEVARMRDRLHEIASGLVVLLAQEGSRADDLSARLVAGAGHGGEVLIAVTRAARERLRELAIRATGSLPGSGGESAVGQIAGISAAKAVSVCVAGALTASCVLVGIGGFEAPAPKREDRGAESTRSIERPSAPGVPHPRPPSAPTSGSTGRATTGGLKEGRDRSKRIARSTPPVPETSSARPTISGRQTGTEYGAEAAGAGVPAPTYSSGASGADSSSTGGSAGGGRSAGEREFGF